MNPHLLAAACAAALLVGCSGSPAGEEPPVAGSAVTTAPVGGSRPSEPSTPPTPAGGTVPAAPTTSAVAEPVEVRVALEPVATLDAPTAAVVAPDGTGLLVVERAGTVRRIGGDGSVGAPVVDIRDEVSTGGERGLLGIALSPDGSEAYLSFTGSAGESRLLAAPVVEDGSIDATAGRDLLVVEQPAPNHNGGDVHVGPDGMLWWGLGDGGGAGDEFGNGQDATTLLGALLRIDPAGGAPYGIPADNPYASGGGAAPEVWAYGLRNPWRFSFDGPSGRLWIADVGQQRMEEVDRLSIDGDAGANLGWPALEGDLPFRGATTGLGTVVPPVHTYRLSERGGCAITGGLVYRGSAIPALRGAYLYSDFCDGRVFALVVDDAGAVVDDRDLGVAVEQAVSFAEDADGEVLVLSLAGPVVRLVPA